MHKLEFDKKRRVHRIHSTGGRLVNDTCSTTVLPSACKFRCGILRKVCKTRLVASTAAKHIVDSPPFFAFPEVNRLIFVQYM